jgi:hypothetical protein
LGSAAHLSPSYPRGGASDDVLEALVRALRLDEAERSHLFDRARASQPASATRRHRTKRQQVRPGVQRILDSMTAAPAFVRNGRLNLLAANRLGYALYSHVVPGRPDFYLDWDHAANEVVAILRSRPAATHTTTASPTSSVSSRRRARSSAPSGQPTTSASTTPASNAAPRGRRRPRADLRVDGARRRQRADDVRLHRRVRLEV